MNIFRLATTIFSLTLLVACGGGGGSGTAVAPATPTTPPPINPLAGLANVNVAAENSSTIQTVERITGGANARIFVSDAYRAENLNKFEVTCPTTTTCVIPFFELSPYTLPFSISNPQPSLFLVDEDNVTGITSRVTEGIMLDGDSVTLARGNLTAMLGSNELEFRTFAGWIDESIFFGTTRIQIGETNPVYRFINHAVGVPSGSNPSGTGSATWEGSTVATRKADRVFFHGDAMVTIADFSNMEAEVTLGFLRDINNPEMSNTHRFTFSNATISSDGSFKQDGASGSIVEGRFYGTGHTEVGGWFNNEDFTGAFAGTRQEEE